MKTCKRCHSEYLPDIGCPCREEAKDQVKRALGDTAPSYCTFRNRDGKKIQLRGDLTLEDLIKLGCSDFGLVSPESPIPPNVWRADSIAENVPVVAPATLEPEYKNDVVVGCPPTTCCAPSFVLEQLFKPGWYLEWWGDGEGGPYWTNDLAKAEKLTMDRAKYEKGMLREDTLIIPHASGQPTAGDKTPTNQTND